MIIIALMKIGLLLYSVFATIILVTNHLKNSVLYKYKHIFLLMGLQVGSAGFDWDQFSFISAAPNFSFSQDQQLPGDVIFSHGKSQEHKSTSQTMKSHLRSLFMSHLP